MNKEQELKEEIERMSDVYEIIELSEESGLQEEFEKDIFKIYNSGYQEAKKEFSNKLEQLKKDIDIYDSSYDWMIKEIIKKIEEMRK